MHLPGVAAKSLHDSESSQTTDWKNNILCDVENICTLNISQRCYKMPCLCKIKISTYIVNAEYKRVLNENEQQSLKATEAEQLS